MNNRFAPPKKKLKLTAYIFKYKKDFWLQAVGGMIYNTVIVFGAIFLGKAIDAAGLVYEGTAPVSLFYQNLLLFLGFTLTFQLARYFKRFYMRLLVNKMNGDIRAGLLDTLFSQPLGNLSSEKTGDIMSRMVGDVDVVGASVQTTVTELWDTALLMLSYFIACLFYSPQLTLVASIPIPLALVLAELLRHRLYDLSLKSRKAASKINVHLQHNVTGITLLRLFGLEQTDWAHFDGLLEDQYKWQVKTTVMQNAVRPLYILLANVGVVLVLGMGGKLVASGGWTIGTFTAYLSMFIAMATRINVAAQVMNTWHSAKASWDRICEKLAETVNDEMSDDCTVTLRDDGLSVRNLHFSYPFTNVESIKGVCFNAKKGEIIGITGPVGSGKSALAAAISGLYHRERNPKIAYMDGSHFIFSDDVAFNIGLGEECADLDAAIRMAELKEDVAAFDHGIETRLMERGVRVSGGQRQRIALARAWASDCELLILDDPFSAVDSTMEQVIMKNLRASAKAKIILLFSHRLATFPMTDRVVVLQSGLISDMGSHEELYAKGGLYAEIYRAQQFLGGDEHEK